MLFERTNGGTRPTLAGQEFLDAARHIVEDADWLSKPRILHPWPSQRFAVTHSR
jgi:DNA-binding transcriptional LysR family regulator